MTPTNPPVRINGRSERGQSLVEFALMIPLFLLLLVAVFDLGRAVFAYNSVTNAAREGVRLAIVNQDPASIRQRAISQTAIAETGFPNVTVAFWKSTPNGNPESNLPCSPITSGCIAVVKFETTFKPLTPIISNILFGAGVTLRATSEEAVEFVCPNSRTLLAAQCPRQP